MDSELKQAILELVRVMDRIGFNGRAQPNGAPVRWKRSPWSYTT